MTGRPGSERLAELRARAAARRALYPYFPDPEHDAHLSAENAPFAALQWETAAWAGIGPDGVTL